jgi:hypothetical protein
MSEDEIRKIIIDMEYFEGRLANFITPNFEIKSMIATLRMGMLGTLPFLETELLVIREEEPQG